MHVQAGAFVELLVPLARGADYTGAVTALREARELLRQGRVEPAIVEARKAVEQVRVAYGTQKLFSAAVKSPRASAPSMSGGRSWSRTCFRP